MCPSEIGVQYQPDGRLSTLPKNTATLTGKLLIVPHSAHNTC
jgi:ornithine carbamoyltransferase